MVTDPFPLLRAFALFDGVPDEQLYWLAERATFEEHAAQATLYTPDDPVDDLVLLLHGQVRLEGGAAMATDALMYEAPYILGVLPYSRMTRSLTYWRTDSATQLVRLHRSHLVTMTCVCYELTTVFVHFMTSRVRDFTKLTQQTEKMAALGRMSAGLAHELNNPVAAVVRTVTSLSEHLHATPERFNAVMALRTTPAQTEAVSQVLFGRMANPPGHRSAIARARCEDGLLDWLDDHGVAADADLTGPLVDFGFTPTDLDAIDAAVAGVGTPAVLGWVVNNLITEKLVRDIGNASERIALLVKAMKSYTHMDRGSGRTTVVLREGLESTLTLLAHKVKAKGVDVHLDLPDTLPTVPGWPGELNQVWTNLLDNALDALPERGGRIEIRAEADREFVVTHLIDNGSGIPAEIQERIFEPFYTTKPVGQGTGLGLDIVRGIIRRHHGSIKVESAPGRTEFLICLPAGNA